MGSLRPYSSQFPTGPSGDRTEWGPDGNPNREQIEPERGVELGGRHLARRQILLKVLQYIPLASFAKELPDLHQEEGE